MQIFPRFGINQYPLSGSSKNCRGRLWTNNLLFTFEVMHFLQSVGKFFFLRPISTFSPIGYFLLTLGQLAWSVLVRSHHCLAASPHPHCKSVRHKSCCELFPFHFAGRVQTILHYICIVSLHCIALCCVPFRLRIFVYMQIC